MRSVGGVGLTVPGSNALIDALFFLSPLTHCCLLDSPQRQQPQQQTLPLLIKPHHTAAHFQRHISNSTSEKAHFSSARLISRSVNPRVSIYASATAQRYANCHKPSPLKWTKSSLLVQAPVMKRYHRMTTPSESQASECSRLLRRVSSAYPWSCRR